MDKIDKQKRRDQKQAHRIRDPLILTQEFYKTVNYKPENIWRGTGANPWCPMHAAFFSVSSYKLWPCWFRGPCFPFLLLHSFCSSSVSFLYTEERDLVETSHLGLSFPRSFDLCNMSDCGSLYLLPSTAGGNISVDEWARNWFVSIAECHSM